jgi:hypothetical protein
MNADKAWQLPHDHAIWETYNARDGQRRAPRMYWTKLWDEVRRARSEEAIAGAAIGAAHVDLAEQRRSTRRGSACPSR